MKRASTSLCMMDMTTSVHDRAVIYNMQLRWRPDTLQEINLLLVFANYVSKHAVSAFLKAIKALATNANVPYLCTTHITLLMFFCVGELVDLPFTIQQPMLVSFWLRCLVLWESLPPYPGSPSSDGDVFYILFEGISWIVLLSPWRSRRLFPLESH